MPLILQSLNFAIVCDGNELETYDVKQEGPNTITAFVASEAGKVSDFQDGKMIPLGEHEVIDRRDQQFSFTISSNLSDFDLVLDFYIDGTCAHTRILGRSLKGCQILGIRKSATSVLPFKFQELELVGAFPEHYSDNMMFDPHLLKIRTWKIPLSRQK